MYALIKVLLRDNLLVNPLVRNVLRILQNRFGKFKTVTNLYRIFGKVKLQVNGVKFYVFSRGDDFIANELYYQLGYEGNEFDLIKILLNKSKYLIDVGANTGIFSLYAASLNDRLKVLSFEPHPGNFKRLIKNIAINNLKNIKPFPLALGSKNGQIEFTVPLDLSIAATASANQDFSRSFHKIDHTSIEVEQTTLTDALSSITLSFHDIIKIDVEYYELEVLKGAEKILYSQRPLILIEVLQYQNLIDQFPEMKGKINPTHADEIYGVLSQLGYSAYAIGNGKLHFIQSIRGQKNRNFLFLPNQLPLTECSFAELQQLI